MRAVFVGIFRKNEFLSIVTLSSLLSKSFLSYWNFRWEESSEHPTEVQIPTPPEIPVHYISVEGPRNLSFKYAHKYVHTSMQMVHKPTLRNLLFEKTCVCCVLCKFFFLSLLISCHIRRNLRELMFQDFSDCWYVVLSLLLPIIWLTWVMTTHM